MRIRGEKSRTFSTNSLFTALTLGMIGWGLLHAWGISVKTGMLFHALAAIPGLVLSGVVFHRYRQHWPIKAAAGAGQAERSWHYRALVLYPIPAAAGFGFALSINSGSLFLVTLASMGMILVPWCKISVCREHFFFSSALTGAGALPALVMLGSAVHPLYYPMVAWLLLSVACTLVMLVIAIQGERRDRMPASGY